MSYVGRNISLGDRLAFVRKYAEYFRDMNDIHFFYENKRAYFSLVNTENGIELRIGGVIQGVDIICGYFSPEKNLDFFVNEGLFMRHHIEDIYTRKNFVFVIQRGEPQQPLRQSTLFKSPTQSEASAGKNVILRNRRDILAEPLRTFFETYSSECVETMESSWSLYFEESYFNDAKAKLMFAREGGNIYLYALKEDGSKTYLTSFSSRTKKEDFSFLVKAQVFTQSKMNDFLEGRISVIEQTEEPQPFKSVPAQQQAPWSQQARTAQSKPAQKPQLQQSQQQTIQRQTPRNGGVDGSSSGSALGSAALGSAARPQPQQQTIQQQATQQQATTLQREREELQRQQDNLKQQATKLQREREELQREREELQRQQDDLKRQATQQQTIQQQATQQQATKLQRQQDDLKRQQDDLKRQQDDLKRQATQQQTIQQQATRQQDDLKLQQDDLKRQQDDLKRQQDDLKRQQDDLKLQPQLTSPSILSTLSNGEYFIPFKKFLKIINQKVLEGKELGRNEIALIKSVGDKKYKKTLQCNLFVKAKGSDIISGEIEIIGDKDEIIRINNEFETKQQQFFPNVASFTKYGSVDVKTNVQVEELRNEIVYDMRGSFLEFGEAEEQQKVPCTRLLNGLNLNVLEEPDFKGVKEEIERETVLLKAVDEKPILTLEDATRRLNGKVSEVGSDGEEKKSIKAKSDFRNAVCLQVVA
ncbi:MAG: DUF3450 domain-containing protein, partial [Rickettsiales bacterium]|nr:DUF3450 domain-containing protein [Rickettsiales bacterium]